MTDRQYDDRNRGALFRNERKETEKHPDYKGTINVAGHDYWLSAWLKESRDGKKYMSLSIQLKDGKPAPVAAGRRDEDFGSPARAPQRRSMKDEREGRNASTRSALKADQTGTAMRITPTRPDRARIDLTDDVAARAWAKRLGKSLEEIASAIEKVGDNASAVKKELGCKADVGESQPTGG